MRLVEAVARELLHQVEDLVGLRLGNSLGRCTFGKRGAVRHHLVELFLAHRTAQQVGAAERVTADDLGHLHHLLLVDHDPVGLLQHLLHQRMRVLDFLAAMLARAERRDQVHRPRAVQGHERDHVLEHARLRVAQHALHARAFQLEHGDRLAFTHQAIGAAVVERQVLECEVLLIGVALADEVFRQLQDRQRRQAQKVELHQADGLDIVLVELAHRAVAARLHVERAEVGDLARRDQHPAGMHADVAHDAFHPFGQRQQLGHFFFVLLALLDLGRFAARVDHARVGVVRRAAQASPSCRAARARAWRCCPHGRSPCRAPGPRRAARLSRPWCRRWRSGSPHHGRTSASRSRSRGRGWPGRSQCRSRASTPGRGSGNVRTATGNAAGRGR